jgi:hypothetical protein
MRGLEVIMKKTSLALFLFVSLAGCAVGYRHRAYGDQVVVAPDYYGTVTYYDAATHRVDLDYVDAGVHHSRSFYHNGANTRWDGLQESDLRPGVVVHVHGRQNRNRWEADMVGRDDRH